MFSAREAADGVRAWRGVDQEEGRELTGSEVRPVGPNESHRRALQDPDQGVG
jgi:hypothetical protein